jgi:UPF0755 protein
MAANKRLSENKKNNRRKEDTIVKKIVTVIVIALFAVLIIIGFTGYRYVSSGLNPLDSTSEKKVHVTIPIGSSNSQIGDILEKKKVIKSGTIFNYYTKFKNLADFQSGRHTFTASMSLDEVGKELQKGANSVADAKITIPEGYSISQIASVVAKKTDFTKKQFLALMKDEEFIAKMEKTYPDLLDSSKDSKDARYHLEGYLFPATYDYYENQTLKEVVTQMVEKSSTVMSAYYDQIAAKGLTVQQTLTLASLVEKEGVNESDRKNIAQVFYNRINADMPLQSDISILYAIDKQKETVTIKDTQVDSPYNLYVNKGYGPGPFNNPSEAAIEAVLNPTANSYYYFVANIKTGDVYFAATYEEHEALVAQYVNN